MKPSFAIIEFLVFYFKKKFRKEGRLLSLTCYKCKRSLNLHDVKIYDRNKKGFICMRCEV